MKTIKVTDTSSEYLKQCHAPKQPVVFGAHLLQAAEDLFAIKASCGATGKSVLPLMLIVVLNIHKVNDMQLKLKKNISGIFDNSHFVCACYIVQKCAKIYKFISK